MIHAFAFKNPISNMQHWYMLDVESGAIHELDKLAYEVAHAIEHQTDPFTLPYAAGDIRETLDEFGELRALGMFDSAALPIPPGNETGDIIKSMCLHVAHDCNLRCKYCFADTGEFQGARKLMPLEVGKRALEFLITRSGNRRHLEVDLFGGEPLLNFPVVQEIVGYGRELERMYQKSIHFTMTTNGVGLDAQNSAFLNQEMHNIVLSLDGRREVHDQLRPTAGGKGSYDIILPRMQALVRNRGEKEYYVRGTFTNKNLDFTQDVRALRDAGFEQISLEPVVLDASSPYAIREEHIHAILEEYDRLCAFVLQSEQEGNWFNFFHFMLDLEEGPCLQKRVKGCGAGLEYVAITPEGDIYPCHQFVGEEAFRLGNVLEGGMLSDTREAFRACNIRTKPTCISCWAKYFCSGGCAANAWKFNGTIMHPEELTCMLLKKRTECGLGIAMLRKEVDMLS